MKDKLKSENTSKNFKRAKERFEEEIGISEELISYYNVAYLKNSDIVESILLIGKLNIMILQNFSLDEQRMPYELGEFLDTDKSKWLIKNFKQPLPSFGEEEEGIKIYNPHYDKSDSKELQITKIKLESITEIHTSRYWLKNCAIEILTNRRSFFLVPMVGEREKVYNDVLSAIFGKSTKLLYSSFKDNLIFTSYHMKLLSHQNKSSSLAKSLKTLDNIHILKDLTPIWTEGKISNFEYLLLLNSLAGRTYSDLSQYPVFPWVLANYHGGYQEVNLLDIKNFRDFSKPMGAIKEERANTAREFFINTKDNTEAPPYNYGSHYSNPGIILYFLIRFDERK